MPANAVPLNNHLDLLLLNETAVVPAEHGIVTQAWSPIGGITAYGGVFDFDLTAGQLDALDTGVRGGPKPDSMTVETYGRDIP